MRPSLVAFFFFFFFFFFCFFFFFFFHLMSNFNFNGLKVLTLFEGFAVEGRTVEEAYLPHTKKKKKRGGGRDCFSG